MERASIRVEHVQERRLGIQGDESIVNAFRWRPTTLLAYLSGTMVRAAGSGEINRIN